MSGELFFDDVEPGLVITTGGIVVTESHVVQFAGLAGDFFDVHMDERFAQSVGFPRRVAHGLLCLSLIDGLKNRAATRFAAVASLEWTSYRFLKPVFIGDRLQARLRVLDRRATRDGTRGVVRLEVQAFNQHGEIVQQGANALLVRRRTGGAIC